MNRWYAVQSNPKAEFLAVAHLDNQGFETFLPLHRKSTVVRKQIVHHLLPVFPSYLFVSFDPNEAPWRSINGTRGVKRLLGSRGDSCSPIRCGVIEELREEAGSTGIIDLEEATSLHYEKGADLKITDGPFAGQDAICIQSVIDRVRVAISLLGYQHVVSIPVEHLARAL